MLRPDLVAGVAGCVAVALHLALRKASWDD